MPACNGCRILIAHLALSLPFDEQATVVEWFESKGVPYQIQDFGWVGWRGIFTTDPEGNTVELVAYHPFLLAPT